MDIKKQKVKLKEINNILLNEIFTLSFNCKLSKKEQARLFEVEKTLNNLWDELKGLDK